MTFNACAITRRSLLGAALAGTLGPRLAFGQAATKSQAGAEGTIMRIRMEFVDHSFTARLEDNPSARDLVSILPLNDLKIGEYGNNEKISYLPRKLTERGSSRFDNEAPGDIFYYAPWGNLVFYYAKYGWSHGLIRLGRIDGSFAPLLTRGEFPLRIEPT